MSDTGETTEIQARHGTSGGTRVSIVIKALNEEEHIAASIESALKAIEQLDGEVVLADSLSSDRTVEIARGYPITIAQLVNPGERCCGIGPQLGYQHARGDFVYILDGDMELDATFLRAALEEFARKPSLAGVAGQIEIIGGRGYEFQVRKQRASIEFAPGKQSHLACGGLYRRAALEEVGYFSNRNLHAYEEKELGLRLLHAGWSLERMAIPALRHHVHNDETFGLMRRRWRSRYVDGAGELLRSAWGRPYFAEVLASQLKSLFFIGLWLFMALSLLALPRTGWPLQLALLVWLALYFGLVMRKRSFRDGFLSLANLQIYAAGFLRGLLSRQVNPQQPIASSVWVHEHER